MSLISVRQAQERLLSLFNCLDTEELAIQHTLDRVLAETVCATADLPPFTASSMDGFAVRSGDVSNAASDSPSRLIVVGDIPAGFFPEWEIQTGQAARIMTGAPLPAGADAVVPVEFTDVRERDVGIPVPEQVAVLQSVAAGDYVRPAGQDVHLGQEVLKPGKLIDPQDIGMLAMIGRPTVPVFRRPGVALLSSGDELLPLGEPLQPGKVYDANTYALQALAVHNGADVVSLGVAQDRAADVRRRLNHAIQQHADLIISSAGVSVGAFDFVRHIVETHGKLNFWRVNMRPGKPVVFGEYRGTPFIGLPGNPVSAFVTFLVFVRPVLRKMSGLPPLGGRKIVPAVLAEPVSSDGRESYLRAIVFSQGDGLPGARLSAHQGSGNLLSLVKANALLMVPSGTKKLPAGAVVSAWMLD